MPNLLQYGNAGASISPSTAAHYTNFYEIANQYPQSQLETGSPSFPYGTSSHASAALLASQSVAGSANPSSVNYAYAALAQQAIAAGAPSLTAAYQQ